LRTWIARLLIGIVTAWNLQAAFVFITYPSQFSPAFELSGFPGITAIRGFGILFLMWNIPYIFAAWNPVKNRLSLIEALLMQFIGLLGESVIFLSTNQAHQLLHTSILCFIMFDGAGLGLLLTAFFILRPKLST